MNLAVVPSAPSSSPNSERLAGPSTPSSAMPHVEFDLPPRSSQRAEKCRCAAGLHLAAPPSPEASGSAFPIKTGSEFPIGISLLGNFSMSSGRRAEEGGHSRPTCSGIPGVRPHAVAELPGLIEKLLYLHLTRWVVGF